MMKSDLFSMDHISSHISSHISPQVLLFEPNEQNYQHLKQMLMEITSPGVEITRVKSAGAARVMLDQSLYNVCLVSLDLFDECTSSLIQERSSVGPPFVGLMCHENFEVIKLAQQAGVADCLLRHQISAPLLQRVIGYAIERAGQVELTQKAVEAALRRSEEKYRLLWAAAEDAYVLFDRDNVILEVNASVKTVFGYDPEFLIGQNLAVLQPERFRERHRQGLKHYLETGCKKLNWRATQALGLHRDGREIPLEIAFNHARVGGEDLFAGFIRDETERKQAEAEIHFQRAVLKAQTEASVDGILVLSDGEDEMKILSYNQRLVQMWSISEEILATKNDTLFLETISNQVIDPDQLWENITHRNSLLKQQVRVEVDIKDGRVFERYSAPITDKNGSSYGLVWFFRDITEAKRADLALRASEERFQNIVANVPGTVYQCIRHPNGSLEWPFVSNGCMGIFEVHPEVIQHNPDLPLSMLNSQDLLECQRDMAVSEETLQPWRWEGRLCPPSGATRWVQIEARPRRLPSGGTLWDGLVTDVTARKDAEEERDRFFDLSLDILAIVGSDGYIKRLNRAFEETLDFSDAELMAVPFLDLVHPDDRAATIEAVKILESGNSVRSFENRYRCRDGSYRWLRWMSAPSGKTWYCVAHDITAAKQTAEALLKANDELELHVMERTAELNASNQALLDSKARLLRGNHIFTNLTGLHISSDQELQEALAHITEAGSTLLNVERCSVWVYDKDETVIRCLDLYQRSLQSHSQGDELSVDNYPSYFENLRTRRMIIADDAHNHPATFEFSEGYLKPSGITSMIDTPIIVGGRMVGVLCCEHMGIARQWQVEEQTFASAESSICALALESLERTRAEAALQQAKVDAEKAYREADAANLAKSEFLSRMSHELRTPLNAILGFGQILGKEALTPLQHESTDYILKGGHHLLDLINEVLDISRVEAGGVDILIEAIALKDIIPEACALVNPLAEQRGIRLIHDLGALRDCHVLADRQRLRQVVINLLSNAIKYNQPGGEVSVLCHTPFTGRIRICVRDTGPGLSPSDMQKLFTPFERLGAMATDVEGTGLGLVLSQRLVTAMGGTLGVESVVGQGSIFSVELAHAEAPEDILEILAEESDAPNSEKPFQQKHSVLCIEDNPSNLRLIEIIFQMRPSVMLLSATEGQSGLDLAREYEPSLILLDLHLPDMPGQEVLSRLRRSGITKDIPIIVISADATPPQIQQVEEAGAIAYLTKPLNVTQFLRILDDVLQQPVAS